MRELGLGEFLQGWKFCRANPGAARCALHPRLKQDGLSALQRGCGYSSKFQPKVGAEPPTLGFAPQPRWGCRKCHGDFALVPLETRRAQRKRKTKSVISTAPQAIHRKSKAFRNA